MQSISDSSRLASYQRLSDNESSAGIGTVRVKGGTIHWPNDGWYEVQYAESHNTLTEGGRSASPGPGVYNVINHSTGERFDGVVVSNDLEADNSYETSGRSTTGTEQGALSSSALQNNNRQAPDYGETSDGSNNALPENSSVNTDEDPVQTQTTTTTTTYPDTTPEDYSSDRNNNTAIGIGIAVGGMLLGGPIQLTRGLAGVALGSLGGIYAHRVTSSETVVTTHGVNSDGSSTHEESGDTRLRDAGHDPLSSTTTSITTFESGRQVTTVTDSLTGEQRTIDVDENGVTTITVSTADTSASSSPRTNRTWDEDGVLTETSTSPTGGTYGSSTTSQDEVEVSASTEQQTADSFSDGKVTDLGEFEGTEQPEPQVPQWTSTTTVPTRGANNNSDSETDKGAGGGVVSSSQSAEQGGWGSSDGGEFG